MCAILQNWSKVGVRNVSMCANCMISKVHISNCAVNSHIALSERFVLSPNVSLPKHNTNDLISNNDLIRRVVMTYSYFAYVYIVNIYFFAIL